MEQARKSQDERRRRERTEETFSAGKRLSGIEEYLRRWDWHLPEGYSPVSLQDCSCRELVLVVHGGNKTLKLNRDGRLHRLHPRTSGVREEELPLDLVRDTPVKVLKL